MSEYPDTPDQYEDPEWADDTDTPDWDIIELICDEDEWGSRDGDE